VSIQAIVLTPIYLHEIGPRLYGAWLGSGDILVWLQAFDLGLPNLMIQRIGAAHGRGDSREVSEYFATGAAVLGLVACMATFFAFFLSHLIPGWMGLSGSEARELELCFFVGSLAAAVIIFNNSAVGFSRGIQDTTAMNLVVLISSLAGFAMSLGLVLTGHGLWAIALGLATRAVISLCGSLFFVASHFRGGMFRFFRVRRQKLREFLLVSPITAISGLSYAMMNQSESALVAFFIKPELAAVLTVTRKAADLIRSLVDMIGFAAYGSFAHLIASEERHRALQVHAEISSLRLSFAIVLASAYIAVNASLVSVWVGSSQYGGHLLTIMMALQIIVVGGSYLMNYLYRATGPVIRGSIALVVESAARIPMMIGFLLWLGLPGIPLAGIVTAGLSGFWAYRWTVKDLATYAVPAVKTLPVVWLTRFLVFAVGLMACLLIHVETWTYVIATGFTLTIIGGLCLLSIDPQLRYARMQLVALHKRLNWMKVA